MAYQTIACLSTAAGYSDNATNAYWLGEGYPTTRQGLTFGAITSGGSATTLTGSDFSSPLTPLISGRISSNSSVYFLRVDLPNGAGKYRIKMGLGHKTTGLTTGFAIYSNYTGGTLLHGVTTATLTAGQVLGVNGTIHANATDWAANTGYVELDLTGPIYIAKSASAQLQLNAVLLERQVTALEPLKVRKYGVAGPTSNSGVMALQDTVHAKQPSGEILGIIETPVGLADAITIVGGGLASYLTVNYSGGKNYLVYNSTRVPDTATPTLTLRQTTTGETKDTSFTFTLVAAGDRPVDGTILGQITTPTWLHRAKVKAKRDAAWFGYAGQSFVTDVAVASADAFTAAWEAITPNGTGWYRIRLQNGTYAKTVYPSSKNFGTGGILVEPDTGHDPDFSVSWTMVVSGLHLRGFRSSLNSGSTIAFRFGSPSSAYTNKVVFESLRIGRMYRDGAVDSDVTLTSSYSGTAMYFSHGESLVMKNMVFDGATVGISINGVRTVVDENNEAKRGVGDVMKFGVAVDYDSTSGFFADNDCYYWRKGQSTHQQLDYDGFSTEAHQDNAQGATFGQNKSNWYKQTGKDGLQGISGSGYQKNWQVGNSCHCQGNGNVYVCATAPITSSNGYVGGITGATMPTAMSTVGDRSTGIVDGELTWDFLAVNPFRYSAMWVYWEDCVVHAAAYSDTGNPASTQFFINSNGGFDMPCYAAFVNCVAATPNIRGITNSGIKFGVSSKDVTQTSISGVTNDIGTVPNAYAVEFCSWVSSAKVPSARSVNLGQNQCDNGVYVTTRKNIVGMIATPSDISTLDSQGEIVSAWDASSTTPPSAVCRGGDGITTYGDGRYGYSALFDDRGLTPAEVASGLSKVIHHNTGAAGARLKETHTITVTDSLGASVTLTLDVAP